MVTSYTPNLNLAKPLVNGPETENTWGFDINANFDKLDVAVVSTTAVREIVEDIAANLIKAGNNVAVVYDDAAGRFTIHGLPTSGTPGPQNVFDTIHDARLQSVPPELKVITLSGYDRPGDAGPAMPCRRTATMVTRHKGVFRSADRYTDAGVVDGVNGGWWEYIGNNQALSIEWFGGKADYHITPQEPPWSASAVNPTPTDNRTAFNDAMQFLYSYIDYAGVPPGQLDKPLFSIGPTIQLGYGSYYFSDALVPDRTICIKGMGNGYYHAGAGTRMYFSVGKSAFVINSPTGTLQGAGSTIIRDIFIGSLGFGGQTTKHGIVMRSPTVLENMTVYGFGGNGIDIFADVNGGTNANLFHINHVVTYGNAGHGVFCQGGDANAGNGFAVNAMTNGGWGIYDNSFLGNTWVGCHTAGNAGGPYFGGGLNQRSVWIGCYSESDQPPSQFTHSAVAIGGLHAAGINGNALRLTDSAMSGHFIYYTDTGTGNRIATAQAIAPNHILGIVIDPTGVEAYSSLVFDPASNTFAWCHGDAGNPVGPFAYEITSEKGVDYGRGEPVGPCHFAVPRGLFLGGPAAPGVRRLFYTDKWVMQFVFSAGHDRSPGGYRDADIMLVTQDSDTSRDYVGEYCIRAGGFTPNVWTTGTTYASGGGANSYVKNSAGRFYRCMNAPAVPSTVQPTHTSGTVTLGDTYQWLWVADQPAIFKRFGNLLGAKSTTVNDPITNLFQQWNDAAIQFVGHTTNITDTASHTDSMLEEWCVGGARKASIRKDGVFLSNGVPVVMAHELDDLYATIAVLNDRLVALEAK